MGRVSCCGRTPPEAGEGDRDRTRNHGAAFGRPRRRRPGCPGPRVVGESPSRLAAEGGTDREPARIRSGPVHDDDDLVRLLLEGASPVRAAAGGLLGGRFSDLRHPRGRGGQTGAAPRLRREEPPGVHAPRRAFEAADHGDQGVPEGTGGCVAAATPRTPARRPCTSSPRCGPASLPCGPAWPSPPRPIQAERPAAPTPNLGPGPGTAGPLPQAAPARAASALGRTWKATSTLLPLNLRENDRPLITCPAIPRPASRELRRSWNGALRLRQ